MFFFPLDIYAFQTEVGNNMPKEALFYVAIAAIGSKLIQQRSDNTNNSLAG